MKVIELSDPQLNFLLARLVDEDPNEFTLENPTHFKQVLLDSRATLGTKLERGDFYGNYRATIHCSLSLLEHDSYNGTVDATGDTPERALGRAVLHSRFGYEDLPQVVLRGMPNA